MATEQMRQLGEILVLLGEELDVPRALQDDAFAKYDHLGEWSKDYADRTFATDSKMYVQGSFGLGTPIRPVKAGDEYDIDLVFERKVLKSSVTQEDLKQQVGTMLSEYARFCEASGLDVPRVEEKRRCWTLDYPGRFHMDVLPALPNADAPPEFPDRIWITDKQLLRWQASDPMGYRGWFRALMTQTLQERRVAMAAKADVDVESMPEYVVRTPLQRVVQLLKRHRDIRYVGDKDYKPASIIISTIAGLTYADGRDLASALEQAAKELLNLSRDGTVYEILSPVNDDENFADKWNEDDGYPRAFHAWASTLATDIGDASAGGGIDQVLDTMKSAWGEAAVERAGDRHGDMLLEQRKQNVLRMASGTGALGSTGETPVRPHTFFGDVPSTQED